MHGLDAQFFRVVTSKMFGGYRDVEAMGIDMFVPALVLLDIQERRARESSKAGGA